MTTSPILDATGRPRSVWSALLRLSRAGYADAVRALWPHVGRLQPELVLADSLLWSAVQARSFEPLPGGGWRVYLDKARSASVEVAP